MKQLFGTYLNHQKEIPFSISIPERWDELDAHQFATIIQVLHYHKADKYTISVSLLALLFGDKNYHILKGLDNENPEENYLHALIPVTNFLVETKPPVKNLFPTLNIRKKKCLAPAADLSNIGFGEWCFIYQFYQYYLIDQSDVWLNQLIAVLYRPADPDQDENSVNFNGDLRERFNENLIEKRAKDVAAIEYKFKLAVLAWFTVAIQQVMEGRPHVFPSAAADHTGVDIDQQPERIDSNSRTWLTVFRELLGPKWGTEEKLKYTNAMFILDGLEEQQIAYDEALSQTAK